MTDKPIIFSAPMVRALIEGRKTQTRRVLKVHPDREPPYVAKYETGARAVWIDEEDQVWCFRGPAVGDRLWVKEAIDKVSDYDGVFYRADYDAEYPGGSDGLGWRSPIHMPRWASRLTLTVTDVRVQRVQNITARDIIAEGKRCSGCHDIGIGDYSACRDGGCWTARNDFRDLWNTIHGPDAWERNPWVAAYTFTVQRGNIDGGQV